MASDAVALSEILFMQIRIRLINMLSAFLPEASKSTNDMHLNARDKKEAAYKSSLRGLSNISSEVTHILRVL